LNIQIINPAQCPGWNNLLRTHSQTTFFHTANWAAVLNESYQYSPRYFAVIENNKIKTLLSLMEVNSFLTGRRGVSLPFTDQVPLISENSDQFEALLNEIATYGKKTGWKYFELRGEHPSLTQRPSSASFIVHTLDLNKNKSKIFTSFRSSTQRNIKKANRLGTIVKKETSLTAVKEFYRLNCMTRRDHGLPPQPRQFFKKLHEHVFDKNKGFVILSYHQNTPIAGAIYFHFKNHAIYKYGASDKTYQHLRPNNLVMWEAIKWFAENGFKTLNLGRTELTHHGLRQFKRGWGTTEETLTYHKYNLSKDCFVAETPKIKSTYPLFNPYSGKYFCNYLNLKEMIELH